MPIDLRALLAEFEAADLALNDPIEAVDDIGRLNIQGPTSTAVQDLSARLRTRRSHLQRAIEIIRLLIGDAYPEIPKAPENTDIANDVAEQARTVTLAKQYFPGVAMASQVQVDVGPPVPKRASVASFTSSMEKK